MTIWGLMKAAWREQMMGDVEKPKNEMIGAALGRIPQGLFILTAKFEDRRNGMLVSWVQQASFEPPMVCVTVGKGRPIMPLISDSREFGLCQLSKADKVILRKFASGVGFNEDPFLGLELLPEAATSAPILKGTMSYMACELVCHMDVEGDHDLFVGRIVEAGFKSGEPQVHLRENGFKY